MAASRTWQRWHRQRRTSPGAGLSAHATVCHPNIPWLSCEHSVQCVCACQEDLDPQSPPGRADGRGSGWRRPRRTWPGASLDGAPCAPARPAQDRNPALSVDQLALQLQQVRMHAAWERSYGVLLWSCRVPEYIVVLPLDSLFPADALDLLYPMHFHALTDNLTVSCRTPLVQAVYGGSSPLCLHQRVAELITRRGESSPAQAYWHPAGLLVAATPQMRIQSFVASPANSLALAHSHTAASV